MYNKLKIKEWAEEDRPREKLLAKGVMSLSDAELLAILIGSGNKDETAVELSQRILSSINNNLNSLGKLAIADFIQNFKGIGEAKAITIVAALELGRRRKSTDAESLPKIIASKNVYDIFHSLLADLGHEEVWVLLLNKVNKVIKKTQINKGNTDNTLFDIRIILKEALINQASGIILCHNHPTNDPHPSIYDDEITEKLRISTQTMDIALLDHVIICDGDYYSYKDDNKL